MQLIPFYFLKNRIMEVKILYKNDYTLYAFMRAVRGNWRNALYIECNYNLCAHKGDGFLFVADADGKLILVPVSTFQKFSGESIDPTECQATLSRQAFESVYSLYIEWHTSSNAKCSLWQLLQQSVI